MDNLNEIKHKTESIPHPERCPQYPPTKCTQCRIEHKGCPGEDIVCTPDCPRCAANKTAAAILHDAEEDFVAPIGNFYMTPENRERTFELWRQFKLKWRPPAAEKGGSDD